MFFKWLIINKHLMPSLISFVIGSLLLIFAPLMYQMRTKTMVIFNPFGLVRQYNKSERKVFYIDAVLLTMGLLSLIVITDKFGYYYFNNGVPTLLKQ